MSEDDRKIDPKEIARKLQEFAANPPPEVVRRMRRGLEEGRKLRNPAGLDQLMANRY